MATAGCFAALPCGESDCTRERGKGPFFRRLGPRNCCWFVGQGRAGLIGRGVGGGKAREEDEGKCEDVI
jgi:hypothetical protein